MPKKIKKDSDDNIEIEINEEEEKTTIDETVNLRPSSKFMPWVEKYRPKSDEELMIPDITRKKIKEFIDKKEMPNLIFVGPSGTGKTTSILLLSNKLLGKYVNNFVLELNASDDRGVKSVQDPITKFCMKKMELAANDDLTHAKHKIILLDEADSMTPKAQQLISTLMEKYKRTTRFAFTCNNSEDIIGAIQTRCMIFRYTRLSSSLIKKKLECICKLENVVTTDEGLDAVVSTSQGDMRQAINNLQSLFNGTNKISANIVYKFCGYPEPMIYENLVEHCSKKEIKKAIQVYRELVTKGYSLNDILLGFTIFIKTYKNVDEAHRVHYIRCVSETTLILNKGIANNLQIDACIVRMSAK